MIDLCTPIAHTVNANEFSERKVGISGRVSRSDCRLGKMNIHSITPLTYIVDLYFGLPEGTVRYDKKKIPILMAKLQSTSDFVNMQMLNDNSWEISRKLSSPEIFRVRLLPDRISVVNEYTSLSKGLFMQTFVDIIKCCAEVLKLPIIIVRSYTLRVTAEAQGSIDSREFIGDRVCGLSPEKRDPFKRPIHLVGLRFLLPPYKAADGKEMPNEFNVKVESRVNDPKKMFIENAARFMDAPCAFLSPDKYKADFDSTDRFIVENVATFLTQFNID